MVFRILSSGYAFARWNLMVWAQWPANRAVRRDDFFQPDWSYSESRERECNEALEATRSAREDPA